MGNRDWVAKYGFGISTADLIPGVPNKNYVDPNKVIRDKLGQAAGRAYDPALYGSPAAAANAGTSGEGCLQ